MLQAKHLHSLCIAILIALTSGGLLVLPAHAIEAKSRCLKVNLESSGPLDQPSEAASAKYKVTYKNDCTEDIPQVDVGLVERDGYSGYRYFTTGGKVGRVEAGAKGEITLTLTFDSFNEIRSTLYLLGNAQFPLQSKTESALTSVTFSNVKVNPNPVTSEKASPAASSIASPTKPAPAPIATPSRTSIPLPSPSNLKSASKQNNSLLGKTCSKANDRKWEKSVPIVCKKNSKGKFVWQLFANSRPIPYTLTVVINEMNETLLSIDPNAVWYCNQSGEKFKDLNSGTLVQIKNATGSVLGQGSLGDAIVLDTPGQPLGTCRFTVNIPLEKSNYYEISIGARHLFRYSFEDLNALKWRINVTVGESK